MKHTVKQTAGNNAYLRSIKKAWNAPIYKDVLRIFNDHGFGAAQVFLSRYTTRDLPLNETEWQASI